MKKVIFVLLLLGIKCLAANIITDYSSKLKSYHDSFMEGGKFHVTIYHGILSKEDIEIFDAKIRAMRLEYSQSDVASFLKELDIALRKTDAYYQKKITNIYAPQGFKSVMDKITYVDCDGKIAEAIPQRIQSRIGGMISSYDKEKNELTILDAKDPTILTPYDFSLLDINILSLDINRFLVPNPGQTIMFENITPNSISIIGCFRLCEVLDMVVYNGIPVIKDIINYESKDLKTIRGRSYYRAYKAVEPRKDWDYPSLVCRIQGLNSPDGQIFFTAFHVESWELAKNEEKDISIEIPSDVKISTRINQ